MELRITGQDPFKVLSSTKTIVESLQFITINENKFEEIGNLISLRLTDGIPAAEMHFGTNGATDDDVQLIFLEDVVNFCFWAERGKKKWEVGKGLGGWYSLTKCFQRAAADKIPILEPEFLISLNLERTRSIFKGTNEVDIPLLEKRLENLQEAGKVLKEKYNGKFINALEDAGFDTIKIVNLLIKDFPSFRDIANFEGRDIYFLKRAQICSQDFSYFEQKNKKFHIKNIDVLSAFADYKIPQILRKYGIISYSKNLADRIDNYVLIPSGSREEIEIRSATIWVVELIKQKLEKYTSADIDNALWLISQNQKNIKPYHRTYTIYY